MLLHVGRRQMLPNYHQVQEASSVGRGRRAAPSRGSIPFEALCSLGQALEGVQAGLVSGRAGREAPLDVGRGQFWPHQVAQLGDGLCMAAACRICMSTGDPCQSRAALWHVVIEAVYDCFALPGWPRR